AADQLDLARVAQLGDVGRAPVRAALDAPAPRARALLRLAGVAQQRLPVRTEVNRAEPAPGHARTRRRAAGRRDPRRPLPHLQVGLGAVPHVALELRAAELAQRLEPVGVLAVCGNALLVVVEGAIAGLLAL